MRGAIAAQIARSPAAKAIRQVGKVPHAEVEIEYLNHEPDIANRRFEPEGKTHAPQDAFVTLSIRADANGQVIIGLPAAGWWGICALDLDGDELLHEGKPLSLDAVLWVQATAMPGRD